MLVYVPGTYVRSTRYLVSSTCTFVLALEGGVNCNPSSREVILEDGIYPLLFLALEGGVNSNPSSRERYATLAALGTLPRAMFL